MRLQDYPKPRQDNGRGVHWIPFTWGQVSDEHKRATDELYGHLKEMDIRWVLILNGTGQEWRANEYLVRKLVGPNPNQPDIMPIVRIGTHFDPQAEKKLTRGEPVGLDPDRVRQIVSFYRGLGVPYFQLYNEPNHIDEWPDHLIPQNAAEICVKMWVEAALATLDAGGLPGFPPPAPGGSWPGGDDLVLLASMLDVLTRTLTIAQQRRLYDKMWVGIHNYFLHRPILGLPSDSHGFQKFVWYEGIIEDKLGQQLPLLTGEGGLRMGPPPYGDNASEAQVAAATKQACQYMAEAPAYYFCNCLWLLGSAIAGGSQAWEAASWFRQDGSRQEVVSALKRLESRERDPQPPRARYFYRSGYPFSECHLVRGPFLERFDALGGLSYCGYPTSSEMQEGNRVIQGFQKLTLEKLADGKVHVRGQGPRRIRLQIPTVSDLLAAKGLSERDIEQALAEIATQYAPPEELTAGEYTVQISGQAAWRNQDVINAFWIAGGRTDFALLARTELDLGTLAQDREGTYDGPALDELAGLSTAERERLLAALPPLASRQIAFRIPSIYALLEAKGLDSQTTARALQLVASTYGPPELLTPGKYTVIISEEPELPVWGMYTNQEIINAFWVAGNKTWHLLNKAGLDLGALAADRQGAYRGPTTEDMDNLTAQEKAWIKAALPNKVPPPIRGPRAPASVSVTWQPAAPANCTGGRQGHALDMIILHATRRGLVAALEAAQRPIGGSSPHYIVGKDGAIYQLVRDEDTAHHATLAATQPQRDIRVRPNVRSLGVALENWGQAPNEFGEMEWDPYTAEQYESLQRLIRALCKIHDIPLKFPQAGPAGYAPTPELAYFRGLIGYSALDPGQPSPGPAFDWSLLGSESE